jgi:hypothetical protein
MTLVYLTVVARDVPKAIAATRVLLDLYADDRERCAHASEKGGFSLSPGVPYKSAAASAPG